MKKTVLLDWKKIIVEDAPIPTLEEDEALIKLKYGGICGTDIHVYSHRHATATIPRVLGHEYCGEIVKINTKGDTDLKLGDFVTSHPLNACGNCNSCLLGKENVCSNLEIYGVHTDGCFAEYFKVPIKKIYKINKEIDPIVAAQIEPLAVALHDVSLSKLERGQSVFIISAGPIGLLIALVARQCGASKIVMSELNDYRIRLAQSMGFTVLNPTEKDFEEKLLAETNGEGFNVIFEVSGSKQGSEIMTKITAQRATIVIVGVPVDKYPVDTGAFLAKELKAVGVRIHNRYAYKEAVEMINSGVINEDLKKLVTNIFPLDKIEEAISFSIEDKEHFKVLLKP
ncbi:MAG: alcohol dehydrogenase catalytic domain-containing protein [Dysgonamonadaceae bacterium]|nr:alcohol dehydrogenase catalytic domain-containing protein [Dysgonamonadaceae bacterium]MDD4591545.1 alcohol dehydrogenase catalytic domain-containing protein [Parabacteroides sp.]